MTILGLLLAKLVEKLSGKKLVGIEKRPRLKIHSINNLGQVFKYGKILSVLLYSHLPFRFLKEVPIVINNIQPEGALIFVVTVTCFRY